MQDAQHQLFDSKWPVVQRAVAYRCRRMRSEDADDVSQIAAVVLLRTIARGVETVSADWITRAALTRWRSACKRHAAVSLGEQGDGMEAKGEASFNVDGVRVTATDAWMDAPELCGLWVNGIGSAEVARRLGVSRQAVYQQAGQLGGVAFAQPGRRPAVRRFPADTPRRAERGMGLGAA